MDRVIGHRGCAGLAPENTEAGIRLAAKLGVSAVEVDVTMTDEGYLPIFHDSSLARCTNGRGDIGSANWDYLSSLDNGSWFDRRFTDSRILQLHELLALITELDLTLNLELKVHKKEARELAMAAGSVVSQWANGQDQFTISSFSHEALEQYHLVYPEHRLGYLFEKLPDNWQGLVSSVSASTLHLCASTASEAEINTIKDAGYPVYLYTVNQRKQFDRWLQMGVDGIFTDYPDRML
ncbi:hypothetical protein MIB92_03940 [Aestuariirhabdus sp. Z084]|uniref:glycerophosphodiester phosphodiesterase family protein n=1 Tax=Aestuariirhabdus haliotis TaxID=2918751 RepID=UPI00201B43B4|nr:glycerophosphodiester phosphodiesterase family protein [Aestuariirhabdus haliotis]MCL6414792.1 hypothetical protein [Aestuariirhabdus haliotis]MCL6418724.1 hypothetical protein [Aestuariirhabdus haliotis]